MYQIHFFSVSPRFVHFFFRLEFLRIPKEGAPRLGFRLGGLGELGLLLGTALADHGTAGAAGVAGVASQKLLGPLGDSQVLSVCLKGVGMVILFCF